MPRGSHAHSLLPLTLLALAWAASLATAQEAVEVTVSWDKVVRVSKTTPTLQVVVNPMLRRGSPIHDQAFRALHDLGGDYVRYVPWLPYPKLAVAELEPPRNGKTSWDFSLIDPVTVDFLKATAGHPVMLNFSTIPQWMFKTEKPVSYPEDPDQVTWTHEQGTELRDPSMKEAADYYARLVSWYTKGGFEDEYGTWHASDHRYKIDYWEVLNEVDLEHTMTPEFYTRLYDAVVEAIRQVAPEMKFAGPGLAIPGKNPEFFQYFLDRKNHKAGIPIDMISYHFYAVPTLDQTPEIQQFTFFEQADKFLDLVRYIESIRQSLSPETGTAINEIGAISADDLRQFAPGYVFEPIPNSYWNLCAALYAYVYGQLAQLGIDVAAESQLVGYPTQFPSVTMVDWTTGQPNARYWALKLLRSNFGPGDKLVETRVSLPYLYAQAFVTRDGQRRVLLVSKRNRLLEATLPGAAGARVEVVDQATGLQPPATTQLKGEKLNLEGLAVAVVTLPH